MQSDSDRELNTHPKNDKVILVAVDNSDYADLVCMEAARLSLEMKADVIILSVVPVSTLTTAEGEIDDESLNEEEKQLEKFHKLLIEEHFPKDSGLLVESMILHGDPASKIVKYADKVNADLIVIGTRGRGKVASLFLGSVSEKVAHQSKRSVFIVKKPFTKREGKIPAATS